MALSKELCLLWVLGLDFIPKNRCSFPLIMLLIEFIHLWRHTFSLQLDLLNLLRNNL